ncbi:MAG: PD-(D/E)XK nuclease family protein [Candidatus Adlerbacteria bacterium]
MAKKGSTKKKQKLLEVPIKHWSHSSLMAYLRNPLAWYKRYVEQVYDMPSGPSSVVGRAGHVALQHYYGGIPKEGAVELGLEYLRNVADFEINFGKAKTKTALKKKREQMERDYLQAVGFYLAKPPKYKKVLGVEFKGMAQVEGLPLPIKAVSDLVVQSAVDPKGVDVIDHKFVDHFSGLGANKSLFVIQAIFNYYTVKKSFNKPVRRFVVWECKKSRNADGKPQMRKYVIDFRTFKQEFIIFNRLVRDATAALERNPVFLPNPSDMFEGENSFDIYRINLPPEAYDAHFRPDQ